MTPEKVSLSEVVRHAFDVGVDPVAVIQLLALQETLPDIFTLGWEILVDDHNFPEAQWLERVDPITRTNMWIADTNKQSLMETRGLRVFGKKVRAMVNSEAAGFIGTGGFAIRAGLHRLEVLTIMRGQVPYPQLFDLLPQIAAGVGFSLERLIAELEKAIEPEPQEDYDEPKD